MSCDQCKYCNDYAFKTNGDGDFICQNRANTGNCEPQEEMTYQRQKELDRAHYDTGQSIRQLKRSEARKTKGKRKYGYK
jgi:type I site-specific restriction endonuclease